MKPPIIRTASAALILSAFVAGSVAGQQNLYPEGSVIGGVKVQQYNFDSNTGIDHVRQIAFPLAVVMPLGQRFSFDIGAWYATTSVASSGAGDETFSSLTRPQRAAITSAARRYGEFHGLRAVVS